MQSNGVSTAILVDVQYFVMKLLPGNDRSQMPRQQPVRLRGRKDPHVLADEFFTRISGSPAERFIRVNDVAMRVLQQNTGG